MGLILAPILEGKVEAWKQWTAELDGPRKAEFENLNKRYGLTRHAAWLTETPAGPVVIALHEGPGADGFMAKIGPSTHAADLYFKEKLKELHGMDVTQPPPGPLPEIYLDSGS